MRPALGFCCRQVKPWLARASPGCCCSQQPSLPSATRSTRACAGSSVISRATPDRGPLRWLLPILLFGVFIYGGFFNAGLGILALSDLILAGETDIHVMNGLKRLISNLISVAALLLFGLQGAIAWGERDLVLIGTLAGGSVAAHLSRQIPPDFVK
ncbi:TSUP family transporter [Thiohalocapsa marina]|uniref:TSUP family transporter n=1 Tax=Thiohalocapsa marina TaxID=424902 RepID=UPI0036DBDFD4